MNSPDRSKDVFRVELNRAQNTLTGIRYDGRRFDLDPASVWMFRKELVVVR